MKISPTTAVTRSLTPKLYASTGPTKKIPVKHPYDKPPERSSTTGPCPSCKQSQEKPRNTANYGTTLNTRRLGTNHTPMNWDAYAEA